MDVGKAIREIRKEKNVTQGALAKMVGLSHNSLCQIEAGNKRPHEKNLILICEKLETPEYLFYLRAIDTEQIPKEKQLLFKTLMAMLKEK